MTTDNVSFVRAILASVVFLAFAPAGNATTPSPSSDPAELFGACFVDALVAPPASRELRVYIERWHEPGIQFACNGEPARGLRDFLDFMAKTRPTLLPIPLAPSNTKTVGTVQFVGDPRDNIFDPDHECDAESCYIYFHPRAYADDNIDEYINCFKSAFAGLDIKSEGEWAEFMCGAPAAKQLYHYAQEVSAPEMIVSSTDSNGRQLRTITFDKGKGLANKDKVYPWQSRPDRCEVVTKVGDEGDQDYRCHLYINVGPYVTAGSLKHKLIEKNGANFEKAVIGPGPVKLNDEGFNNLPDGSIFIPEPAAAKFLANFEGGPSATNIGVVIDSLRENKAAYAIDYHPVGYVRSPQSWSNEFLKKKYFNGGVAAPKYAQDPTYEAATHTLVAILKGGNYAYYESFYFGANGVFEYSVQCETKTCPDIRPFASGGEKTIEFLKDRGYGDYWLQSLFTLVRPFNNIYGVGGLLAVIGWLMRRGRNQSGRPAG